MLRRSLSAVLLTAGALFVVACDDATSPDPQTSSLTVQVYVDADGNGSLGAGDDPIDGAQMEATEAGGATITLTTGANGTATTQLPPGTYTLSLLSGAPVGATLATASHPVFVAEFFGSQISQQFRFVYEPGGIAGAVYRDDDESGDYDPEIDTPAPGLKVYLFPGGASEPTDSTATDEAGTYAFEGLRPGGYMVVFDPPETIELVDGNERQVAVEPETITDVTVQFLGSLLSDISDARSANLGSTVTVEGVVTWVPSFSPATYYIQDATGGIGTFDSNEPELAEGDRIQITGTLGAFRGELQVSPVTSLIPQGTGELPAPRSVTAAEINAGSYQGELVTVDATVTAVEVLSFGNQDVTLEDGAGGTFKVYSDSRTGVEESAWTVGETYTVSGILTIDDRQEIPHRIEVRGTQDVVLGGSVVTIAEARALEGETVIVEGVVSWQIPWSGGNLYFYQDETGGILSFHNDDSVEIPTLNRGDRIRVGGVVSSFRGEVQISPVQNVQVLGSGDPPLPRVVSGDDINAGLYQGELVTIAAELLSVDTLSFGNQAVLLTEGGNELSVYVDSRNGVTPELDLWKVGDRYLITGVVGVDDRQELPYRVEPRDVDDIQNISEGVIEIADARGRDGETVTVVGLVTWQNQWDDRIFFFEDGTGGLSVFYADAPEMNEGDAIRITGSIGAFRGEVQISPESLEILATGGPVDPTEVTGAEINAGEYQAQLVTLRATVVSVEVLSFDNQSVTLEDGAGTQFMVYSDSRTGVLPANWPEVGTEIQVTGVLGYDDRNDPAPRLEVRRPEDIADAGPDTTPLGEARGLAGQTVTVAGVVTWQNAWDDRIFFFQDETGGISTFYADAPDMNEGDRILVTGEIGGFRGEIQISPVSLEVTGSGPVPDARGVTGAEINAGEYQGELVTLEATVVSVEVLSFSNQRVLLKDGSGTDFFVYSDSRTGVQPAAWPEAGGGVTVTGVLGFDERTPEEGGTNGARLEVRTPDDVEASIPPPPTVTLAEARALEPGTTVVVEGVVSWQTSFSGGSTYFFQDETAGISVFHSGAPALNPGDRIRVTGTMGAFRGEIQIAPAEVEITGSGDPPAPRVVTGAEINAGDYQGELVSLSTTVIDVEVGDFDNQRVTLQDGAGTNFFVYADSRTGVVPDTWPAVGSEVQVTGVLGFDERLPEDNIGGTNGARLEVRSTDDVVSDAAPPTTVTLAEARALAPGTVATVEGVVSWQTSFSGGSTYFFQDETAGISVFHSGAPALSPGDRILVTGEIGAFRGEVQISPSEIQITGSGDPPTPRVVTAAEINAGDYQGELVTLRATLVEVEVGSFDNQRVTLQDGGGTNFLVYSDSRTGVVPDTWPDLGTEVDITGVLGFDERALEENIGGTNGARLEVRSTEDIAPVPAGVVAAGGDR